MQYLPSSVFLEIGRSANVFMLDGVISWKNFRNGDLEKPKLNLYCYTHNEQNLMWVCVCTLVWVRVCVCVGACVWEEEYTMLKTNEIGELHLTDKTAHIEKHWF